MLPSPSLYLKLHFFGVDGPSQSFKTHKRHKLFHLGCLYFDILTHSYAAEDGTAFTRLLQPVIGCDQCLLLPTLKKCDIESCLQGECAEMFIDLNVSL